MDLHFVVVLPTEADPLVVHQPVAVPSEALQPAVRLLAVGLPEVHPQAVDLVLRLDQHMSLDRQRMDHR